MFNSYRSTYGTGFLLPAASRLSANALHVAVSPEVMTELTERASKKQGVMRTRLTNANMRDVLCCGCMCNIGGKEEWMIIRHAKYPSLQKKTYPWVPKIATTIAIMNSASAPHATTTSPQIENKQLAFWPGCSWPSNVACRIHSVRPSDATSFCFVAKVPKEITAVNRTVKYTTAMMQWNKRDRPFCNSFDRFCFGGAAGVGASILQVRFILHSKV